MVCFLTSRIDNPDTGKLNPANQFIRELQTHFPNPCRALDICSDPEGWEKSDFYAALTKSGFENAGFSFEQFLSLDSRNENQAAELVRKSNLLILSGGHVPTQNRFFDKIRLRGLMKDYNGVVIGISAGSMNSADIVYAQPEEEGEAIDPAYQRFLSGLNLTKTSLIPHYQEIKDDILDGLRIFEDIAYPDSMGKAFYAIPDGSYLFINDCKEELRGEAYLIKDGLITQVSSHNDIISL